MRIGRIALFAVGGVLAAAGATFFWPPKFFGLAPRPEAGSPGGPTIYVRVISADRVMIGSEEVTLAGYEQNLRQLSVSNPTSHIVLEMIGQMSQSDWDRMKAAIPANGLSGSATSSPISLKAGGLVALPELNAWVGKVK